MIATRYDFSGFRASLLAAGFDGLDALNAEDVVTYTDARMGRVHLVLMPGAYEGPGAEFYVIRFYAAKGDYAADVDFEGTHQECLEFIEKFLASR